MTKFEKIFKTKKPLIGMIHLPPLPGYTGYLGIEEILKLAKRDMRVFEKAEVSAVIVENNYDIPHKIEVEPEVVSCMAVVVGELVKSTKIPVGICVLWNDYKAALSICLAGGAKFVRIPAFVDSVRTSYGLAAAVAKNVKSYAKRIGASEAGILADIHVKHARMVNKKKTIEASAVEAVDMGADALIVTGKWTGDAPIMNDLEAVRKVVGDFPVLVGSGADAQNLSKLLRLADGVIVGTSIKTSQSDRGEHEINLLESKRRINYKRTTRLSGLFKDIVKSR